jgi:hypothetical protein
MPDPVVEAFCPTATPLASAEREGARFENRPILSQRNNIVASGLRRTQIACPGSLVELLQVAGFENTAEVVVATYNWKRQMLTWVSPLKSDELTRNGA